MAERVLIDEVQYSDFGGRIVNGSGRYQINGHMVSVFSLSIPGTVEDGELFLPRPDPDLPVVLTWVYKEIAGQ